MAKFMNNILVGFMVLTTLTTITWFCAVAAPLVGFILGGIIICWVFGNVLNKLIGDD